MLKGSWKSEAKLTKLLIYKIPFDAVDLYPDLSLLPFRCRGVENCKCLIGVSKSLYSLRI